MDLLTIIQAVLRRWYVAAPILLAFAAGAYYVNSTIPPQFEARGQVLLADPELDPSNLPRQSVSLTELVDELQSSEVLDAQLVGGATLDATARRNGITLEVEGETREAVQETVANARSWLATGLEEQQERANIEPLERLRLSDAGVDAVAEDEEGLRQTTTLELEDPAAAAPNPYGASNQTGRLLIVATSSDAGRMRVAERTGPDVSFEVSQDSRDAAPILSITTFGPAPQQVIEAYDDVTAVLEEELEARESRAEVPPSRQTSIERIAVPQQVADVSPPLDRSVAAIVGVGGLLALAAALALDSMISHRRARIADGPHPAADQVGHERPDTQAAWSTIQTAEGPVELDGHDELSDDPHAPIPGPNRR